MHSNILLIAIMVMPLFLLAGGNTDSAVGSEQKVKSKALDIRLLNEIGDGLRLKKDIDYSKINKLIRMGADINSVGNHFDRSTGIHPLYLSVSNGDLKLTKFLLIKGANVNIHFDDEPGDTVSGETPLMCAIKNGYNKIAVLLIENGADVNLGASNNTNPLSYARYYSNEEMEIILIKNGAIKKK